MENTVTFKIENCMDCPNHYVEGILTADSFEHESGCFCKKVKEDRAERQHFHRQEYKMVACDDWHLEKYTQIPDWCPLIQN